MSLLDRETLFVVPRFFNLFTNLPLEKWRNLKLLYFILLCVFMFIIIIITGFSTSFKTFSTSFKKFQYQFRIN